MIRRKLPGLLIGLLILKAVIIAVYVWLLRPWHLHWGTTERERLRPLPGDDIITRVRYRTDRAVSIRATPAEIWPWLVQMGPGRGGYYSYDWLENMMGLDIHSVDKIIPHLQDLEEGDIIPNSPQTPEEGVIVAVLETDRALVVRGTVVPDHPMKDYPIIIPEGGKVWADWTWAFVLEPVGAHATRLITRLRADYEGMPMALALFGFLEPGQAIMERKMLLGIKERAEHLSS